MQELGSLFGNIVIAGLVEERSKLETIPPNKRIQSDFFARYASKKAADAKR